MNRATLLIALFISLNAAAQLETGTIRVVKKKKTVYEEYAEFMRETPKGIDWWCRGTTFGQRNLSVLLGAGSNKTGYIDMGIISATPFSKLFAGAVISVKPKIGSSLSPFAQWTIWEGKNDFRIASAGLRGFLPLDGHAENGIQPYIAWSIPAPVLWRCQFNIGYEFRSGQKTEVQKEQNALHLGLWFFL